MRDKTDVQKKDIDTQMNNARSLKGSSVPFSREELFEKVSDNVRIVEMCAPEGSKVEVVETHYEEDDPRIVLRLIKSAKKTLPS